MLKMVNVFQGLKKRKTSFKFDNLDPQNSGMIQDSQQIAAYTKTNQQIPAVFNDRQNVTDYADSSYLSSGFKHKDRIFETENKHYFAYDTKFLEKIWTNIRNMTALIGAVLLAIAVSFALANFLPTRIFAKIGRLI
jgi:hypothetical protein